MSEQYAKMAEALIAGKVDQVVSTTQQLLADGVAANQILQDGLLPGMNVVGQRFKACEMFIPEVLRSAKAMAGSMELLRPLLSESDSRSAGKFVIGTVKGDLHDIGKNLVGMMLKGAGFDVVDLGHDVHPEKFVDAARAGRADALLMSSLLTTTMPNMANTVAAITEAGLRDRIIIMVGGAPLSERFAREIGADGFAPDAASAVDVLKLLLDKRG
jgi:5-methyltetrahydrofolate--homocysteine methyltransferase